MGDFGELLGLIELRSNPKHPYDAGQRNGKLAFRALGFFGGAGIGGLAARAPKLFKLLKGRRKPRAVTPPLAVADDMAGYLYHYTDDATAALIEKSQLGLPNKTLYLTPEGGLTPLQAQIELALPREKTAVAVFRISRESLNSSNIVIQKRVTGNVFMCAGGGTELIYDGAFSLENVARLR